LVVGEASCSCQPCVRMPSVASADTAHKRGGEVSSTGEEAGQSHSRGWNGCAQLKAAAREGHIRQGGGGGAGMRCARAHKAYIAHKPRCKLRRAAGGWPGAPVAGWWPAGTSSAPAATVRRPPGAGSRHSCCTCAPVMAQPCTYTHRPPPRSSRQAQPGPAAAASPAAAPVHSGGRGWMAATASSSSSCVTTGQMTQRVRGEDAALDVADAGRQGR
jgi:hypothetical protein